MSDSGGGRPVKTARIGVYLCECGPNIAGKIDLDAVRAALLAEGERYRDAELIVKRYGFLCSGPGKQYLAEEIRDHGLTHLVVGACSPRDHDSTFMGVCAGTALNPYLYRIVNIREHCAWVIGDPAGAVDQAVSYLLGGISRVLRQSPLVERPLEIDPDVLVIGGGAAGMEAALALAGNGRRVHLVERSATLGGGRGSGSPQAEAVRRHPDVRLRLEAEVGKVIGFLGNFEAEVTLRDGTVESVPAGAIIVAVGSGSLDPREDPDLRYASGDDVLTLEELERALAEDGTPRLRDGSTPRSAVFVHCAGRGRLGYCSGSCCGRALTLAAGLRERHPDLEVTSILRDLCLPGPGGSEILRRAETAGVTRLRARRVLQAGNELEIETMDGASVRRRFDLVVPVPGTVPAADTGRLAEMLRIPLDGHGFFRELHRMTDPSGTPTDGVFLAGTAHGPKDLTGALRFARSCAGQIVTRLVPGERLVPEVKVSEILEAYCTGCGNCLEVCVYGAIRADADRGISVVNEAVCRGCGNCYGSCPSGALRTRHFTSEQLLREVDEALRPRTPVPQPVSGGGTAG